MQTVEHVDAAPGGDARTHCPHALAMGLALDHVPSPNQPPGGKPAQVTAAAGA